MALARHRLRSSDPAYGPTCPLCAAPKAMQAAKCQECETDRKRANPDLVFRGRGPDHASYTGGRKPRSRAKADPIVSAHDPAHPWRRR
jgi:hypothetical protein